MKTLLIEKVTNGWIVRPFSPCLDWTVSDRGAVAVYNSMIDLQTDLPELLGEEKLVRSPQQVAPGENIAAPGPSAGVCNNPNVGVGASAGLKVEIGSNNVAVGYNAPFDSEKKNSPGFDRESGGDRRPETIGGKELCPSA